MTDDDVRLAVQGLHDSIIGVAYEVARADIAGKQLAGDLAAILISLRTMPPGWHDEWAERVEEYRTYIDCAIGLLRVARHTDPAAAAAAMYAHLKEAP